MIEKIEYGWTANQGYIEPTRETICDKINQLVDAVNELHEEAENNARIRANHEKLIDTLVEENNIHEKQIDELQMKAEPQKCETPVENVHVATISDRKCPTCPICGGDLIKGENFPWFYSCQSTNWKSDADEICELDDCAASVPVWETLRRTRKALEIAVDALKTVRRYTAINQFEPKSREAHIVAKKAVAEITALEQKD